ASSPANWARKMPGPFIVAMSEPFDRWPAGCLGHIFATPGESTWPQDALFPRRALAFGRGGPDVDVGVLRVGVDLGQLVLRELAVGERADAILDLLRPAGADQRGCDAAAAQ